MLSRRSVFSSSALILGGAAGQVSAKPTAGDDTIAPSKAGRDWTIPRPMYWSFDNRDPLLEAAGLHFTVQVSTVGDIENSFGIDPSSLTVSHEGGRTVFTATQLALPGQQGTAEGSVRIEVGEEGGAVLIRATATAMEDVRSVKITLRRLPQGGFYHTGWQVTANGQPVAKDGVSSFYPSYTGGMPVWFLGRQGKGMAMSSLDVTTKPRRVVAQLRNDGVAVELVVEQDARQLSSRFEAPAWEIRRNTTLRAAIASRLGLLETKTRLKRWDDRADVPVWARDVSLVVTLHGMHWSGYIFNDYARMAQVVRSITDRVPGRKVMFFLAGWEGRYYRTYGASQADERMGGEAGLKALVDLIHSRGAHVMAMFAGNASDIRLKDYPLYGPNAGFDSLPGAFDWSPMRGYQVDWAESRGGTTGMAWLNPGHPDWRDHLIRQVGDLNAQYGFDGNFFDTQPNVNNDRKYDPLQGLSDITDSLRERKSDLLLATETWYDLSLGVIPMSQTPDGPFGWSDSYQRRFAHLALGEPAHGSTGVHELGHVAYDWADLKRSFTLPTLGVVEGTLDKAPDKVERVLAAARARSAA